MGVSFPQTQYKKTFLCMHVQFSESWQWGSPPQRLGRDWVLCSRGQQHHWGSPLLPKERQVAWRFLVFHFPIISFNIRGLKCASNLSLSAVSILFVKRKSLYHKRAIILCSRNNYVLVSFKWLLKPDYQIVFTPSIKQNSSSCFLVSVKSAGLLLLTTFVRKYRNEDQRCKRSWQETKDIPDTAENFCWLSYSCIIKVWTFRRSL